MTVMAPVSALSLAALTRFSAGLPLPEAASALQKQAKLPDVVVFSSAPTRILSDLASAGLRQLATLLPMIEQAVRGESAVPLGQLAKAAGAAARQIGDGYEALLGEGPDRIAASMPRAEATHTDTPATTADDTKQLLRTLVRQIGADIRGQSSTPADTLTDSKQLLRALARQIGAEAEPSTTDRSTEPRQPIARPLGAGEPVELRSPAEPGAGPIERWISEAKHLLRSTGDVLERAEEQVRPLAAAETPTVVGAAPAVWVLAEIVAAQTQIASAYAAIGRARTTARVSYRIAPSAFSLGSLGGATTLFGMMLIVTTLWIIGGLWSVATGAVALAGTAAWIWRINRASRGLTLDAGG